MNSRSRVFLVAGVGIAGLLVAGCTDSSAGVPFPATSGSVGTSTPDSSDPTSAPTRPRELRLDGKDPCALVPEADRARFHIERPGRPGQNETFKSPECLYSTNVGAFRVALVMTEAIGKWTDGSRSVTAEEARPVAEFPALTITQPGDELRCDVAVDVAGSQYLLATVIVTSSKASQVPEKCAYAHQLAESAMSTLVGT